MASSRRARRAFNTISLLEAARPEVERIAHRSQADRAFRRAIFEMFPHPGGFACWRGRSVFIRNQACSGSSTRPGSSSCCRDGCRQWSGCCLPSHLPRSAGRCPRALAAEGTPRRRVGLLLGCVQRVFFGEVNEATARVLAARAAT